MSLDNILAHPALAGMRECRQWVVYALVPSTTRPGKADKIPLHHVTGSPTGVNNPASWTDCATAAASVRRWGGTTAGFGVGFCFTEAAGWFFIDLDGCKLPDGTWSPLAQQICQSFPTAAMEISSSGNGLHLFGRGTVPPHASKNIEHHAEYYHTDRFVALSGTSLQGDCMTDHTAALAWLTDAYFPPRVGVGAMPLDDGPCEGWLGPEDDDELLRRAMKSKSAASAFSGKATFADLWTADSDALAKTYPADGGGYDASSVDLALCQMLAFWTGKDRARIARLMERSELRREKWEARPDYIERTIETACSQQRDVLQDKRPEPGPSTAAPAAAPTMTAVTGDTFLNPERMAEHFEGCVYVVDQHRVLVPGGQLLKPEQFNAKFGGYTFAMDTRNEKTTRKAFEAFTESQALKAPKVDGTCFRPDQPYGSIVRDPGRTRANTYSPVEVPRKKGDVTPFLGHLAKLLPNERDRLICLCMLAALVQHQGYKFQWAIVLQGVEGNGKTLLSRCVAAAIGPRYVHWPKASKLAGNFNGWMVGRTFFAVEDIHTSENVDVIEELKPMITGGDGLEIEAKGVDQISAEICGNFIFNTNLATGIRKTRNDRRFCWLATAQQQFADLARDGMDGDYMHHMYTWLKNDGYAIVAEYLWTFDIPDEFNPATGCQRAPHTTSTEAAIEDGRSRAEQDILEAIEHELPGFAGGWVSSMAVDRVISKLRGRDFIQPRSRAPVIEGLGYQAHPVLGKNGGQVSAAVLPDGGKPRLFVKPGHASLLLNTPAEVAKAYTAAQMVLA